MHSDACSQEVLVSKIKVEEKGKQAVFLNPDLRKVRKTQVDGCLVKQATACDWLVVRAEDEGVLVELKGCDVAKAIEQIEATFAYLNSNGGLTKKMAALIVCRNPPNHPLFNSKLLRAKNRLSTAYRAPLHIVSGKHEFHFEKVLSHKGPL